MKLYIEESSWSGWTRNSLGWTKNHKSEKNYEYDIVLNKKYIVKSEEVKRLFFFSKNIEVFSFLIEEIGEDYVIIKVNSTVLGYDSVQMKIKLNQPIKLETHNEDSGETYKISLKQKAVGYEEPLLEKYGNCSLLDKHITILAIADTHNCLTYNKDMTDFLRNNLEYDCCILLGDHSANDLYEITQIIPKHKIYGVLGNHDLWNNYEEYGITNISGKIIEIKGVKIAGLGGSFKYKKADNYALYTHEESIQILSNVEGADILVTHDRPYINNNNDNAHDGLKGITKYIYTNHVPINIHGHLHEDNLEYLQNGTKVIGVYGAKIINI